MLRPINWIHEIERIWSIADQETRNEELEALMLGGLQNLSIDWKVVLKEAVYSFDPDIPTILQALWIKHALKRIYETGKTPDQSLFDDAQTILKNTISLYNIKPKESDNEIQVFSKI